MGKRKTGVNVKEPNADEPTTAERETVKKPKKSKKMPQINLTVESHDGKTTENTPSKEDKQIAEDTDSKAISKSQKSRKKIKLKQPKPTTDVQKSKKVVFVDDNEQTHGETDSNIKKYLDDEEAAVKDDDIDKFCDEIDEEDNKHYEDWVKLVEATLHPTKKKS